MNTHTHKHTQAYLGHNRRGAHHLVRGVGLLLDDESAVVGPQRVDEPRLVELRVAHRVDVHVGDVRRVVGLAVAVADGRQRANDRVVTDDV